MIEEAAATYATRHTLRSTPSSKPAVTRIARALAAVPSLGPAAKAWRKLGFSVGEPFEFMGCRAFDVTLAGGGVRFLAPASTAGADPLASVINDRLVMGSGLLGWAWACTSVRTSRELIEARTNRSFTAQHNGRKSVVVPTAVSPGAVTLLEPDVEHESHVHTNRVESVDHLVVSVSDPDRAADAYHDGFGLELTRKTIADRRYGRLGFETGMTVELTGPAEPASGRVSGRVWGIAFRSADLDETVGVLRAVGVHMPEPYAALHGGRITGLPMSLGGMHIAFLGD